MSNAPGRREQLLERQKELREQAARRNAQIRPGDPLLVTPAIPMDAHYGGGTSSLEPRHAPAPKHLHLRFDGRNRATIRMPMPWLRMLLYGKAAKILEAAGRVEGTVQLEQDAPPQIRFLHRWFDDVFGTGGFEYFGYDEAADELLVHGRIGPG